MIKSLLTFTTTKAQIEGIFAGDCATLNVCPVTDILSRFGDKWSMHTILLLGKKQKMRFNELKTGIKGISQRMLTVTLRSLEEDGLVLRTSHAEIPPRVDYELTDLGEGLLQQLIQMGNWANTNSTQIINARTNYKKQ